MIRIERNPKQRSSMIIVVHTEKQRTNIVMETAFSWSHLEKMVGMAAQGLMLMYDEAIAELHHEYNRLVKETQEVRERAQGVDLSHVKDERFQGILRVLMLGVLVDDELKWVHEEITKKERNDEGLQGTS